MKPHPTLIALALAALAILTPSAQAVRLAAPLPEFKDQKELADWRSEQTSRSEAAERASQAADAAYLVFYTGKPYLVETGSYAFLFRKYDPALARWTSADPSGFPDGANNIAYMAVPTAQLDWLGLSTIPFELSYVYGGFKGTFNYDLTPRHETSSIGKIPGWSGVTSMGGSISIGGLNVGLSTQFSLSEQNSSRYEYKYDDDGYLWQRYVVDLYAGIKITQVYLAVTIESTGSEFQYLVWGPWYE